MIRPARYVAGLFLSLILACLQLGAQTSRPDVVQYVDPAIGSDGLGRVYIGPCLPFGMIKPSPACTTTSNSGWLPMPEQINGFTQLHTSGTGGGPKYGNILITPFASDMDKIQHIDYREYETLQLGYYDTRLQESGIRAEITSAERAALYRFTYPQQGLKCFSVDAGFFLGENPVPDAREAQQFVGSEIEIMSDREVCGYSRIRGGWNNGKAYTVYFYILSDQPFVETATWKGTKIDKKAKWQYDSAQKTGALLRFADSTEKVHLKVGVSFLSSRKAQANVQEELPDWDFERVRTDLVSEWDNIISRIRIAEDTPLAVKRMFYTGIYHSMLMPVDRTGENPLWSDSEPYYDDYYAIWDTYRTSSPLLTLLDQDRQVEIVRSLINIYKRDGYMPDARSGNSNGRTQGGSNAELVISDAFVKGLEGIDYELALEAMLHDATVPPGGNEEAEGRGGLIPYLELGYIPHGIARAGNRTVEYSYCDYAIALLAKGLGKDDIYNQYLEQSGNWKNLWRSDYEHNGVKGFIMPRDADGNWTDDIVYGHSELRKPTYRYQPHTFEGPWYIPWWSTFFYEATSWEYSLSIPHDVPGLIELCGGPEDFEKRLDIFFDQGFFNVSNEPSFLSPCLYHWIGKPWRSSERVKSLVDTYYADTPFGIPGRDDSGAMSAWLVFHIMGLYPNAGQDYYLINTPMTSSFELELRNGKSFKLVAEGLSERNRYIVSATLNGEEYPYSAIRHCDIVQGGTLVLKMGRRPSRWGEELLPGSPALLSKATEAPAAKNLSQRQSAIPYKAHGKAVLADSLQCAFKLHGQTRRYTMYIGESNGELHLDWKILRKLFWQKGRFTMSPEARRSASELSFQMPEDGNYLLLPDSQTAYFLTEDALNSLMHDGFCEFNASRYELLPCDEQALGLPLLHLKDTIEGSEMWVLHHQRYPLIWRMKNNPLEVDWEMKKL